MNVTHSCGECGAIVQGADIEAFGDAYIAHARSAHPDWSYPDTLLRNYAEATQRLTGSTERLDRIGEVAVFPVDEARLDDWLTFFDHDAFAGNPGWASCYCCEPHLSQPAGEPDSTEDQTWRQARETMLGLLRSGESFGYLAYVDGRPAAWVNASRRSSYALYREGAEAEPADDDVIGVSCFLTAPPYRRHGLAAMLLDRVLADATSRGLTWVEAYPFKGKREGDADNFRGPRPLFDERGFVPIEDREHHVVVRRRA